MPPLPTGMVRHSNGRYYLRRRIPQDLVPSYDGKKELLQTLNTSNYRDALERFQEKVGILMRDWSERRQRRADLIATRQIQTAIVINDLTQEDLDRICQHFESASLAGDEQRRQDGNYDITEIEDYQHAYQDGIAVLKAAVAIGDVDTLRPILQQFLDLYHYRVNIPEGDYRRLAIAIGRTAIRTNENLLRRYQGDDVPTPVSAGDQHLLSAVIKQYIDDYPAKKKAMSKKIRGVLPMFLSVVGDKPISRLRQSDINDYFSLVQKLPPRWKDVCRQQKLTVAQVAELKLGEMGPATFDGTYKAAMTPFLNWAVTCWQDEGFPTTLTTHMIKYRGDRVEGEMQQRALKGGELNRLFAGPEMTGFAKNPAEAHYFWLPHLGLYTGARVNELCQLNPQVDIRQDHESGIWFLDITEDSEADPKIVKAVKTKTSKRKVPIHSQLIELGFLEYVAWVRAKGDKLLFAKFPPSVGRASPKAMKWFSAFLIEIGLRDETAGARVAGMHTFRSTLLNRAHNLMVVNAEAITGHASNKTNLSAAQGGQVAGDVSAVVRTYRGELDLKVKQEILERITWPEVSFITPTKPPKPS